MIRLNLNITDELKAQLDQAAETSVQTQSEIVRKAIHLYLAASDGVRRGKKLGLVDPETGALETQIVGL